MEINIVGNETKESSTYTITELLITSSIAFTKEGIIKMVQTITGAQDVYIDKEGKFTPTGRHIYQVVARKDSSD